MYDEQWALSTGSRWGQEDEYNGAMITGAVVGGNRFANPLPVFVTETGYIQRPGSDPGSGQRYCPPDVAGEYNNRAVLTNYKSGIVKRTYLFSLHDASQGGQGTMGICGAVSGAYTSNFDRRASFYALKNLMSIVGFVQPNNPAPISVPMTFTLGPPQSMPSKTGMVDRLDQLILQRTDTEYLIFLIRQRQLWNRDAQTYMVPDTRNAVLTLPSGTWTCSVAEPAKQAVGSPENPSSNPPDGQTYANPTNGTAFAASGSGGPMGITQSGNTLTVPLCGLVRVVKAVKAAGAVGNDAAQRRVVTELN
jgi:hypothetical protein